MQNQPHSLGVIPLSLSKLMERISYYGMRSILVLYMTNQINLSFEHSASVYGIFILLAGIVPILGGLLGDFLISTKTTAIIGGCVQALGFIIMAIPFQITLYLGLFLAALGTGLYAPNIISTLGTLYKNKPDKLDAAMLILYICVNLGAFAGSFFIALASEHFGYSIAFIVCGIVMAGSQLILLLSGNLLNEAPKVPSIRLEEEKNETPVAARVIIICATLLIIPLFWIVYQFANNPIYDRLSEIEKLIPSFYTIYNAASSLSLVFVGIILIIIFSFAKMSSLLKLFIGFIIYAISCVFIGSFCHNEISNSFAFFILLAVFLQAIAESFISPIAFSIICKYGSQKFNSTLIGLHLLLSSVFGYLTSYLYVFSDALGPKIVLIISACALVFFAAIFLTLYLVTKKDKSIA